MKFIGQSTVRGGTNSKPSLPEETVLSIFTQVEINKQTRDFFNFFFKKSSIHLKEIKWRGFRVEQIGQRPFEGLFRRRLLSQADCKERSGDQEECPRIERGE